MRIPFPVDKAVVFSAAEFVSRLLGLMFLARFMNAFGLDAGGVFRTALPLIVLASAVGSVGLPTALTRWLAADGLPPRLRKDQLLAIALATVAAIILTSGSLFGIVSISFIPMLGIGPVDNLLRLALPLLLVLCVSGSLRGLMIGRGRNLPPAIAQSMTALSQVVVVNPITVRMMERLGWSGGEAGVVVMTVAEAVGALVLIAVFGHELMHRLDKRPLRPLWAEAARQFRHFRLLMRLIAPASLQTMFETLGYGLELPMAEYILTQQFGAASAEQWLAEYAAVAIPLLHFPMFAADGLATALLPTLTAGRVTDGRQALRGSLVQIVKFTFFLSLPSTLILLVFARTFSGWLDAPAAAILLQAMCPLAVILFIQAPLAALVQSHGHSRALLWSEITGDVCRLSTLWIAMAVWHLGIWGLVLAFSAGTVSETIVLWRAAWHLTPIAIPWRTGGFALLMAVQMCTVLVIGTHQHGVFGFQHVPVIWFLAAAFVGAIFLIIAGQLPVHMIRSIPIVGRPLSRLAAVVAPAHVDVPNS